MQTYVIERDLRQDAEAIRAWQGISWPSLEARFVARTGALNYVDHGPDTDRPTVVFLHGLGNSWHFWAPTIAVVGQKFRCLAVDMPGFGASTKPATVSRAGMVAEIADLVAGVTDPDQSVVVCGHSLGALVAMELVHALERRVVGEFLVGAGLDRLIAMLSQPGRHLSSPRALMGLGVQITMGTVPSPPAIRRRVLRSAQARRLLLSRYVHAPEQLHPDLVDFALTGIGRLATLRTANLAQSYNLAEVASKPRGHPVVLVGGTKDRQSPSDDTIELATAMGADRIHLLEDVGHWPMLEAPGTFARTLSDTIGGRMEAEKP